jgi:hypothetical protein
MIKANLLIATIGAAASLLATSNAAVVRIDLDKNTSGTANGALFEQVRIRPAGTGVFEPFLTIQGNGDEQGYNSSTGNFDTKREPVWNHEIRFSDLQQTTIGGVAYFGFAIDINEPGGGKADITLTDLRIYTSPTIQNSTSVDATATSTARSASSATTSATTKSTMSTGIVAAVSRTSTSTSRSPSSPVLRVATTSTCISGLAAPTR